MKELDQYQLELVRLVKTSRENRYQDLREWWARRCGIELQYVRDQYIVENMLEIVKLVESPVRLVELVQDAHPENRWRYREEFPDNYWGHWMASLTSRIRLYMIKDIPGWP